MIDSLKKYTSNADNIFEYTNKSSEYAPMEMIFPIWLHVSVIEEQTTNS